MASTKPKKASYTGGETMTGPPGSVSSRSISLAPIITSATTAMADGSTAQPQAAPAYRATSSA